MNETYKRGQVKAIKDATMGVGVGNLQLKLH